MDRKQMFTLVIILTFFGALNTIQLKLQNIQIVNQTNRERFFHPFIQTIYLFIGQSFVGLFYLYYQRQKNQNIVKSQKQLKSSNSNQTHGDKILTFKESISKAFFPALFDLLGTMFAYLALNTVNTVVWQMSKGGVIISTAILSKIILKRQFTNQAIIGCILAFVGITSVQIVAVTTNNQSNITQKDQFIGIALLLTSIFFSSFGFIIEKKIFDKYDIHPLKIVFLQGIIGVLVMSTIAFVMQFVSCPWMNKTQCVCIAENDCYLQNYGKYFDSLKNSYFLIFLTLGCICSTTIAAPIGAYLSKHVSPVSRSLGIVSRTALIWLFNIVATLTIGQTQPQYRLQSLSLVTNLFYGLGFGILLLGIYIYHSKHEQAIIGNEKKQN